MKTFTLAQLKYADEVCFPADFLRLFEKHAAGTFHAEYINHHYNNFRANYRSNLTAWIFSHSRGDMARHGLGVIIDNMLTDLIGNYH